MTLRCHLLAAWDCSAWVRTYALYLEERLECFSILKYDIEVERLPKPVAGQDKVIFALLDKIRDLLQLSEWQGNFILLHKWK